MARPTKLEPKTLKRLVDAIKLGATYPIACKYANISYETFCAWRRKADEEESGLFVEFAEAIALAEGTAGVTALRKIQQASREGTWQASAWFLERRYPDQYGRTVQTQEHTGKDGAELRFTLVLDRVNEHTDEGRLHTTLDVPEAN
jgi:hypothetical protein